MCVRTAPTTFGAVGGGGGGGDGSDGIAVVCFSLNGLSFVHILVASGEHNTTTTKTQPQRRHMRTQTLQMITQRAHTTALGGRRLCVCVQCFTYTIWPFCRCGLFRYISANLSGSYKFAIHCIRKARVRAHKHINKRMRVLIPHSPVRRATNMLHLCWH